MGRSTYGLAVWSSGAHVSSNHLGKSGSTTVGQPVNLKKRYSCVLIIRTCECDYLEKKVFVLIDMVEIKLSWIIQTGPKFKTCPSKRCVERRLWEDGGGGWYHAATAKKYLAPPEARGPKNSPYGTWRECGPDDTFISDLEPPQLNEFVIASHQVCGNLLQQL